VAGLSLKQLLPDFPDIEVNKVELLANFGSLRKEGIHLIPALVSGENKLSGMFLTKKQIRRFLESL
jgi:hypothetical protein